MVKKIKKAFFSCNFQLQSEARRRLLVRSCLGAPPATAHGGHWDVAATGDGLSVTLKFHGHFGDNSWDTPSIEPWSQGAHDRLGEHLDHLGREELGSWEV